MIDPEKSHDFLIKTLKVIYKTPLKYLICQSIPDKPIKCMNINFKNLLGLAAGFDKNGDCIDIINSMGFGFIEVGTVTPKAQQGNNKPRLFRLVNKGAFLNHMGFPNLGIDNLINNIKQSKFNGVLGVNIGKNFNTSIENAIEDYLVCIKKIYNYASYIVINISSPNTPNLRSLQFGIIFDNLLKEIKYNQLILKKIYNNKYVPIVLKISPDLTFFELIKIADSLLRYNIDGIIATNTTTNYKLIKNINKNIKIGGLSGCPLQHHSNRVIKILSSELKNKIPIIGVGGINSITEAKNKLFAGAKLIQIYTGLIFKGPSLIKEIVNNI